MINLMPLQLTKYKKIFTPDFTRAAQKGDIDEFLINPD
jgi:hypothetical protein